MIRLSEKGWLGADSAKPYLLCAFRTGMSLVTSQRAPVHSAINPTVLSVSAKANSGPLHRPWLDFD